MSAHEIEPSNPDVLAALKRLKENIAAYKVCELRLVLTFAFSILLVPGRPPPLADLRVGGCRPPPRPPAGAVPPHGSPSKSEVGGDLRGGSPQGWKCVWDKQA